jgi:hypothetical protein
MTTTLLLDLLVAALLSATIFYCWQLNRRLVVLRGGHDELRLLIENLNEATRRAQAATLELKSSSDTVGSRLNGQMASARALVDELKLIVETGNTLADRVSGGLRGVSGRPVSGGKAAPREKEKAADTPAELRAERPAAIRPVPQDKGAVAALAAGSGKGGPAELLRALREVR